MASSSTLQMPVAIVLVLGLASLLQCLGSGDSDSCGPEAASGFALDDSNDETSLMQLGEKVLRRRLHDGGASADAVADREEDGRQRQRQRSTEAATDSVDASSAASRLVVPPARDAVSEGSVPSTPVWPPRNLVAAPVNDAVMGALANISPQQDPATDPHPKTHPQLAAKIEDVSDFLHKDSPSGISMATKTIQDLRHKVSSVAKDLAAQETTAGHFGLTIVIIGIAGITLAFFLFSCWGGRLDRPRPRNISSIPGRIGSPQPARQVTVQQATHWWHPEPSAGRAVEEVGGSRSPQASSEPLRKPILNPQTSQSIGSGWQTWTVPSADSGMQVVESSGSLERDARLPANIPKEYMQAPSSSRQYEPILPELRGAIVPANRKFIVQVPPLSRLPEHVSESSKTVQVTTNHGEPLFLIKCSRPTPSEAVVIEEYFSISLPDEIDKELLICTFGRPRGPQLQCEIHKSDGLGHSTLFGVMYQEPANSGVVPYTLFLASGKRLLTVMVNGNVKDRQIKIWDFNRPGGEVAAAVPGDTGEEPYKVECYPHSDVILSVIAMTVVDRLAASGV